MNPFKKHSIQMLKDLRILVFISLLIFISSFQMLFAQVQKKINFERVNHKTGIMGPALIGIFSREYDRQIGTLYRVYGDDSLSSDSNDNVYQVVHQRGDLSLFDVTDVEILNDTMIEVSGTYYLQKLDLDSEEMSKNFIIRDVENPETEMTVRTLVKVHRTYSGQPYIKEWHHSQSVVLHDSDIISIDIKNRNRWVASKTVTERRMSDYDRAQVTIGSAVGIVSIYVMIRFWQELFGNRK